jgi:hypothetical protein
VTGPGLAKARQLPFILSRRTDLVRAPDARWRELFERADVVSEGSVRQETSGPVWYGSTSLILAIPEVSPQASRQPEERTRSLTPEYLAALIDRDLHVRLRAVRTAHREACLRAPGRLGRFSCEIRVAPDERGVRIDVDVQAPLIEGRARARSGP